MHTGREKQRLGEEKMAELDKFLTGLKKQFHLEKALSSAQLLLLDRNYREQIEIIRTKYFH